MNAGEDRGVKLLSECFVIRDNHTTTWTAKGLVRCSRCNMGVWEGRRMLARCNETGKVRHVDVQVSANHIRNLTHTFKIDLARDCRTACNNHLWLMLFRERFDLIIVQQVVLLAHAILDCVEPFA